MNKKTVIITLTLIIVVVIFTKYVTPLIHMDNNISLGSDKDMYSSKNIGIGENHIYDITTGSSCDELGQNELKYTNIKKNYGNIAIGKNSGKNWITESNMVAINCTGLNFSQEYEYNTEIYAIIKLAKIICILSEEDYFKYNMSEFYLSGEEDE